MGFIDAAQSNKRLTYPNNFFILGIPGSHETRVNAEFERIYPGTASRRIEGRTYFTSYDGNWPSDQSRRAFAYDCTMNLIAYFDGQSGDPFTNARFWPAGKVRVCDLGDNANVRVNVPMQSSICISSGPTDRRTMAFGPALEFWEIINVGGFANNSDAVPVAAARLLQIKDALNCSWWEVRYRARITAIRTAITHPSGELWNEQNGFGRIDVTAAVAFSGTIPPDPFLNNGNVYLPFVP